MCASVDSAIKLDLNEIKDQYDGLEQIAEGPFATDGAVDNEWMEWITTQVPPFTVDGTDSGNLPDGVYRLRTASTDGDGQARYLRVFGTVSLPSSKTWVDLGET